MFSFSNLWKHFGATPPKRTRAATRSRHLLLETLEARCTPANILTWQGAAGGLWSTPGNWSGMGTNPMPQAGDTLFFNSAKNTSSTDDVAGLSINLLSMGTGYNAGLTLNNDLTVTNYVTLNGSKLDGAKTLTLPNATSTFNWNAGEVAVKVNLGTAGNIATLNINTGLTGVKLTNVFDSYAYTTWTGSGDITMDKTGGTSQFINDTGGTFDIQNNQKIVAVGTAIPVFSNKGTFTKHLGNATTEVQTTFISSGNINANAGTLFFTQGVTQNVGGTTTLNGGAISTGLQSFTLLGGSLTGIGTLTGNLVNTGGTVTPGLNGTPGTLNVAGNFVQGAGGELIINVDAAGGTSLLNVGMNGLNGGDANTGGKLTVNRNTNYKPPVNTVLTFLNFVTDTTGNDFATLNFLNNSWNNGGARSFTAVDGTTTYDLWVI